MNVHPGLTPHALVERARGLTANVAARAAEAEALHRLPDATVREFEAADLCRIWIPRRFGGLEMTCTLASARCRRSAAVASPPPGA